MGAERFLQLFDWNSKSRKKLFPAKSDFPEQSQQDKRSNRSLPVTRYDQVDEVESRAGSSASSVVDEDGYNGVRAPSVVARLMGLSSMPTSHCSEPSSTPFFDAHSLHSSYHQIENMEFERENQMYYSGDLKAYGQSRCTYNSKSRQIPGRPIEKFQSEVLPPRSAKSIPITQHKLLSPIKSSGMFFTGDAAHIMEAAAKIIESGSQAIGKHKLPLVGSSPSPLPIKVKDLKEKVRVTQERPVGFSFASMRVSEKEGIHAAQEKMSSGHLSTSFRMRDKEKFDAFPEKTGNGYSSVSFRMKDQDMSKAFQEKTSAMYATSSFRMRGKERADTADERLENGCDSGSFKPRDKEERPDGPPKSSKPAPVSEKPFESSAAKYLKGQAMNKSWNGSRDRLPFSAPSDAEVTSSSNKGKSVSLAIQAKVNVQKREGMKLNPSRQKEQPEVKSQPSYTGKDIHKRSSMQKSSSVLRQNHQRQNNATDKGMFSKPSISNSMSKKASTEDSSSTRQKSSNKLGGSSRTRKLDMETTNRESDQVNLIKNVPRKKRNIDGGMQFEGNQTADSGLSKSLKSEANGDRYAWIEDSRKKGMDVVSFTFTSPMTRCASGFNSSSQMAQITDDLFPINGGKNSEHQMSSSHRLNVIGSDALSLLLEQKLRELTTGIGPSSSDDVKLGSVPKFESNILCQDAGSTASELNEPPGLLTKRYCSQFDSGFQIKGVDEMDALSSNRAEVKNMHDCHLPSPVSILEGYFSTESCNSSRTNNSGFEDSMPCSSVQACEVIGLGPSKKFHLIEADLSDSASSVSPGIVTNTLRSAPKWELCYITDILSNIDIIFENFSVGIIPDILNPQLFEELEISKGWMRNNSNSTKLERKLYFDCVGEILDLRCKRYVGGGCEAWHKGMTMVKRKEKLAEEMCKEISGLVGLSDCMVDELVDKDMSSQHGKWLNFQSEEFSLGVEMEVRILNSLVDEMIADFLLH